MSVLENIALIDIVEALQQAADRCASHVTNNMDCDECFWYDETFNDGSWEMCKVYPMLKRLKAGEDGQ